MNRSIGELKNMARQMLLGNYRTPMLAMILASMIPSLFLLPFNYLCSGRDQILMQEIIYFIANLIISLIEVLLVGGVQRIHLLIARKQPVTVKNMFWVIENRPDRFILGGLLLLIIEFVPFAPAALLLYLNPALSKSTYWTLAAVLLLAGLIAALYLMFCFQLVFILYSDDARINLIEAFCISNKLMKGAKWKMFVLGLSFIGWAMLGLLSMGIGFLWISPYMTQSSVNFYLELRHEFDATVHIQSTPSQTQFCERI